MNEQKEKKYSEEIKELVLARIEVMPPNLKLSIGNKGTFTKEELKEHVIKEDSTGEEIVNMQLNFIKALTSGRLIETLNK